MQGGGATVCHFKSCFKNRKFGECSETQEYAQKLFKNFAVKSSCLDPFRICYMKMLHNKSSITELHEIQIYL